jgi:hypothetical protein
MAPAPSCWSSIPITAGSRAAACPNQCHYVLAEVHWWHAVVCSSSLQLVKFGATRLLHERALQELRARWHEGRA